MEYTKSVIVPDVPAHEVHLFSHISCDLCGATTDDREDWRGVHGYDKYFATIQLEDGVNYPESGHGVRTIVDICPSCFTAKLLPWIESQGAKPRVEKWDY